MTDHIAAVRDQPRGNRAVHRCTAKFPHQDLLNCYKTCRCRCDRCRARNTEHAAATRRAQGKHVPYISARGAARRLQALAAMGWGLPHISHATGLSPAGLQALRKGDTKYTTAAHLAKIHRAYLDLSPVLNGTRSGSLVRYAAEREGWVNFLAWHNIDTDEEPEL